MIRSSSAYCLVGAALLAVFASAEWFDAPSLEKVQSRVGAVPLDSILTSKLYRPGPSTGKADVTHAVVASAEAPFTQVRLVYWNTTDKPYRIDAAAVAASSTASDGVRPTNAEGAVDFGLFRPVTFNAGLGGSLLVPPAGIPGLDGVPGLAASDWVDAPSLARIDDPDGAPLVMARSYAPEPAVSSSAYQYDFAALRGLPGHPVQRAFWKHGNHVQRGLDGFAEAAEGLQVPGVLQFRTVTKGVTVAAIGDSITQGALARGNYGGWGYLAAAQLSRPSQPVSFFNGGYAGQPSWQFLANGLSYFDTFRPRIVFIAAYSPNNPPTAEHADEAFQGALRLARHVAANGSIPVLHTPIPSKNSAEIDAYRLATVAKVKASGFLYADFDAVLSDRGRPARMQPIYDTGDNVHPNDEGHYAMAAEAGAVLRTILFGPSGCGLPSCQTAEALARED